MPRLFDEFMALLESEDREKCLELVISKMEKGEIGVVALYTDVLEPSLDLTTCKLDDGEVCIWKEHIRSSIIRTIIECCYPHVIKERERTVGKARGERVFVACPEDEYHEIGAKMVSDFFTMLGYDSIFAGANTPAQEMVSGVRVLRPAYVAISVTNFYNIVAARRCIEGITELRKKSDIDFKIIVGGSAFRGNPDIYREMGADVHLHTFEEIRSYIGGGA